MEKRMLTPPELVDEAINVGVKKSKGSFNTVLLGAILAGAYIALGAIASAAAAHSIENFGLSKFIAGVIFPVGLMMIIISGGELFTGNTLLLVGYKDGKIPFSGVLRNWGIVYLGNIIGSIIIACLAYAAGVFDVNGGKLGGYFIKVAAYKGGLNFSTAFFSGILCNILVCLAVWAQYAAKDIVSKVFVIWFPIMAFIVAGFEHSVANMFYFSAGILAKSNPAYAEALQLHLDKLAKVDIIHAISNIVPVTLGNIIGGGIMLGFSYYYLYKRPLTKAENISKTL
ncbi:formate/nitrite transporter [Caloramator fervidus]|uniref:Formate/nitrite transporter n=1 Tax=Caloramator fervidus TaxID=29344 RepID=A0A1H5XBA4_9CLOT|nr:formate/nitrite transporter family protein [Caloramator fervidus]SEG08933.1 formate/nitrite transporter [Caloramator fervidus]